MKEIDPATPPINRYLRAHAAAYVQLVKHAHQLLLTCAHHARTCAKHVSHHTCTLLAVQRSWSGNCARLVQLEMLHSWQAAGHGPVQLLAAHATADVSGLVFIKADVWLSFCIHPHILILLLRC
jgi:hypothetical protein